MQDVGNNPKKREWKEMNISFPLCVIPAAAAVYREREREKKEMEGEKKLITASSTWSINCNEHCIMNFQQRDV